MQPVAPNQQRALVECLTKMCGGGYSPETRRKYFISGPQWAAAYQGQASPAVAHEANSGSRCWRMLWASVFRCLKTRRAPRSEPRCWRWWERANTLPSARCAKQRFGKSTYWSRVPKSIRSTRADIKPTERFTPPSVLRYVQTSILLIALRRPDDFSCVHFGSPLGAENLKAIADFEIFELDLDLVLTVFNDCL